MSNEEALRVHSNRGFTLVEVVIASSVLVVALAGIMAAAFSTYRNSDLGDEYATGSLLAAERLDYFRSQRDPYTAVGGTWYPPPADRKRDVDFNLDRSLHVIQNDTPTLLLREYLLATDERRYNDAIRDVGQAGKQQRNASAASAAEAAARRINWIPDTPERVPTGLLGAGGDVDGIIPNSDLLAAVPAPIVQVAGVPISKTTGSATKTFNFMRAPRANEALIFNPAGTLASAYPLRGVMTDLPKAVRFIREVWVQTNHPLGRPFGSAGDALPGGAVTLPQFYITNPGDIPTVRGASTGVAATGEQGTLLPPFVVAVTVRVYRRDGRVATVLPNATQVSGVPTGGKNGGLGYDPTRPLATMVGYFGLRRFLQ